MEPKTVGALHGAPTFTLTAEQMSALKGQRAGHDCTFTLKAKIVAVDKGVYTLRWEELTLKEGPQETKPYDGASQFKQAVYGGESKGPSKVSYAKVDGATPSVF